MLRCGHVVDLSLTKENCHSPNLLVHPAASWLTKKTSFTLFLYIDQDSNIRTFISGHVLLCSSERLLRWQNAQSFEDHGGHT
jgi:hypothetical protein